MDWAMNKFLIRKLLFVTSLALLVYAPFGVADYKSRTTTDPYILMAREIEAFPKGGVDVLYVVDNDAVTNGILVVAYIEDYPDWSLRQDQPNFKRHVIQAVARYDFESVLILIGWDFPPEDFRVQGLFRCMELRRSSCEWEQVPSIRVRPDFVKWPGIGKP